MGFNQTNKHITNTTTLGTIADVETTSVFMPFPGSGVDGTGDGTDEVSWIFSYDVRVQEAVVKTTAGALTYSLLLGGVVVEGIDNQTVNTSEATDAATAAFSYTAGQEITLAISGAQNAQNFRFSLKTKRD